MRKIIGNSNASVVPILIWVAVIIVCGLLYSILFIEVGFPAIESLIPDTDSKVFIMMLLYALPAIVLFVSGIAAIKNARGGYVYR